MLPPNLLIHVDDREKKPASFPKTIPLWSGSRRTLHTVTTTPCRLDSGDYRLASHPDLVVIERKSGIDELAQNVTNPDRRRFEAALDRLAASCKAPIILVEANLPDLMGSPRYSKAQLVFDRFMGLCLPRGISVLTMGQGRNPASRLRIGEALVRILCSGVRQWPTPLSSPTSTSP